MQTIIPHLWYDGDAVAAAQTYVGLIPGSRLGGTVPYSSIGQEIHRKAPGSVMVQEFEIAGTQAIALNGGPMFRFTPAVSFFVTLPDRADVDRVWDGLAEGGEVLMPIDAYPWSARYGWLNDRWGLSWQIALGDPAQSGRAVAPLLTFAGPRAGGAEAAIRGWVGLFPDSGITGLARYGEAGIAPAEGGGQGIAHGQFRLCGETFMAMDAFGEHGFDFNEAFSLLVRCGDQAEIDRLWAALSAVPAAEACGWLRDRHGVSWQIAYEGAEGMIADPDRARADRVMAAFLGMKKVDVDALEAAYAG